MDIQDFMEKKDEFIEMRRDIVFQRDGTEAAVDTAVASLSFAVQDKSPSRNINLLRKRTAKVWELLDRLEECNNTLDGINVMEREVLKNKRLNS